MTTRYLRGNENPEKKKVVLRLKKLSARHTSSHFPNLLPRQKIRGGHTHAVRHHYKAQTKTPILKLLNKIRTSAEFKSEDLDAFAKSVMKGDDGFKEITNEQLKAIRTRIRNKGVGVLKDVPQSGDFDEELEETDDSNSDDSSSEESSSIDQKKSESKTNPADISQQSGGSEEEPVETSEGSSDADVGFISSSDEDDSNDSSSEESESTPTNKAPVSRVGSFRPRDLLYPTYVGGDIINSVNSKPDNFVDKIFKNQLEKYTEENVNTFFNKDRNDRLNLYLKTVKVSPETPCKDQSENAAAKDEPNVCDDNNILLPFIEYRKNNYIHNANRDRFEGESGLLRKKQAIAQKKSSKRTLPPSVAKPLVNYQCITFADFMRIFMTKRRTTKDGTKTLTLFTKKDRIYQLVAIIQSCLAIHDDDNQKIIEK